MTECFQLIFLFKRIESLILKHVFLLFECQMWLHTSVANILPPVLDRGNSTVIYGLVGIEPGT